MCTRAIKEGEMSTHHTGQRRCSRTSPSTRHQQLKRKVLRARMQAHERRPPRRTRTALKSMRKPDAKEGRRAPPHPGEDKEKLPSPSRHVVYTWRHLPFERTPR
mmetsp:Transcript_48747/g.120888  ORF Transcript_48747/g.120888 Transcript_48747/m.120888 type:complete len:104 (-) Transcript_48747:1898-2209(-)